MQPGNLSDFLEALATSGDLARVTVAVDADLELAAITARVAADAGPALLFEEVRGRVMPVATNLLGSAARICAALGVESLEEVSERLAHALSAGGRVSWLERIRGAEAEPALERFLPRVQKVGACQQVVKPGRDVDLAELPLPRSWPDETHPMLTAGQLVVAGKPQRVCRPLLSVVGRNRLAVPTALLAGAGITAAASAEGQLPVAVVLGGDPATLLLGELPLGDVSAGGHCDPFMLTGLLRDRPLGLVRCRTQPVEIPAEAEIVLEGMLDLAGPSIDGGRFGSPSGYYYEASASRPIEVTAVTHRTHAALPARICGPPHDEGAALLPLVEQMLLPAARAVVPELVDLALPPCGPRGNFLFASIQKRYPHQARQAAGALWGLPALRHVKTIVVVDDDVDVHDTEQVLFRLGAHLLPGRDLFLQDGPPDPFDHAARAEVSGKKLGLDATARLPGEGPAAAPSPLAQTAALREQIDDRWEEYGLSRGGKRA